MIKRKKKKCKKCKKDEYLFSEGMCLNCYNQTYPTFINKKSKNKVKEEKEYSTLRDSYLSSHPFCEIGLEGCTIKATEIHHSKGRGIYTLIVKYFKAVCNNCHRIITDNSKEAIINGHSQSRLKLENDEIQK